MLNPVHGAVFGLKSWSYGLKSWLFKSRTMQMTASMASERPAPASEWMRCETSRPVLSEVGTTSRRENATKQNVRAILQSKSDNALSAGQWKRIDTPCEWSLAAI